MFEFEKVIIESASEGSASELDEERQKFIDCTHDPQKSSPHYQHSLCTKF